MLCSGFALEQEGRVLFSLDHAAICRQSHALWFCPMLCVSLFSMRKQGSDLLLFLERCRMLHELRRAIWKHSLAWGRGLLPCHPVLQQLQFVEPLAPCHQLIAELLARRKPSGNYVATY